MKLLQAKLKENPIVGVAIEFDFDADWSVASEIIESAKRKMVHTLKEKLHEKISELSIDDIEFKIRPDITLTPQ